MVAAEEMAGGGFYQEAIEESSVLEMDDLDCFDRVTKVDVIKLIFARNLSLDHKSCFTVYCLIL